MLEADDLFSQPAVQSSLCQGLCMQTYELTGDSVQQTHIPVPRASYHYLCRDFQFSILEKVVILKQRKYMIMLVKSQGHNRLRKLVRKEEKS